MSALFSSRPTSPGYDVAFVEYLHMVRGVSPFVEASSRGTEGKKALFGHYSDGHCILVFSILAPMAPPAASSDSVGRVITRLNRQHSRARIEKQLIAGVKAKTILYRMPQSVLYGATHSFTINVSQFIDLLSKDFLSCYPAMPRGTISGSPLKAPP